MSVYFASCTHLILIVGYAITPFFCDRLFIFQAAPGGAWSMGSALRAAARPPGARIGAKTGIAGRAPAWIGGSGAGLIRRGASDPGLRQLRTVRPGRAAHVLEASSVAGAWRMGSALRAAARPPGARIEAKTGIAGESSGADRRQRGRADPGRCP